MGPLTCRREAPLYFRNALTKGGAELTHTADYRRAKCGVEKSRPDEVAGDYPADEPRGPKGCARGRPRRSSDRAGCGSNCRKDEGGRAIDLCWGGIERQDRGIGCLGVSANVWGFGQSGARRDCRREKGVDAIGGGRGGPPGRSGARFEEDSPHET